MQAHHPVVEQTSRFEAEKTKEKKRNIKIIIISREEKKR